MAKLATKKDDWDTEEPTSDIAAKVDESQPATKAAPSTPSEAERIEANAGPLAVPKPLTRVDPAQRSRWSPREAFRDARIRARALLGLEKNNDANRPLELRELDPSRPVTEIPPLPTASIRQIEFTPVHGDYAFVRITLDERTSTYFYEAIEPALAPAEAQVLEFVRDTLVRTLDGHQASGAKDVEAYLIAQCDQVLKDYAIKADAVTYERLHYYIVRDFLGYGPLDVLMRDPMIEDISCDGPGIPVFIFHRQLESLRTNAMFWDEYQLDSFVIRLAQRSGRQISIAEPLLDATLPDSSRLQASFSREITTRGSSFTIRKFRADPFTPPDLIRTGTMSSKFAAFLWLALENGNSMIIAGGTASGKTTILNAMSLFIPPEKKIVSIEETRELNLPHENWVAGQTRTSSSGEVIGGKFIGSVDMYKLLESALRQRPEYVIVGEVRGAETFTLFQAMATGHAVYSTMHADSVASAVYRLENEPINVPRIMLQTVNCFVIMGQVKMGGRMVRRIKEVAEITGIDPDSGDLLTNTVFRWNPATDQLEYLGHSHMLARIQERKNLTEQQIEDEWERRRHIMEWAATRGVRHFRDVAALISGYYRVPASILDRIERSEKDLGQTLRVGAPEGTLAIPEAALPTPSTPAGTTGPSSAVASAARGGGRP
ncbi:MAG: type II/IV secretion system ATPase subunit [Thermoplasmatota archaeon]